MSDQWKYDQLTRVGINIKSANSMKTMKHDMSGSITAALLLASLITPYIYLL
jgi:hypothetical protein